MCGDLRFSIDRSLSLSIIYVSWKNEENLCCGSLIFFFNFSDHGSSNSAIILAVRCWQKPISKVEFNWKDWWHRVKFIYLTDPLKWNLTEKVGLSESFLIFSTNNNWGHVELQGPICQNFENEVGVPIILFCISDIGNSLSDCSKSMKKSVLQRIFAQTLSRVHTGTQGPDLVSFFSFP